MQTATVEEVQAQVPKFLEELTAGGEFLITSHGKPVGRLVPPLPPKGIAVLGRGQGKLISYVEDDEHLRDFADDEKLRRRNDP